MIFRLCRLCMLVLVTAACGDAAFIRTAGESVTDSAGIRIVDQGVRADDEIWRVLEPVWEVGLDESVRFFDTVRDGVLVDGGRAVIGDFGPRELVVIGLDGTVDQVAGGEGQGPEEFGRIWSLTRLAGDTLLIEDPNNARVSLWHPTHGHVDTHPRTRAVNGLMTAVGAVGGRLLLGPGGTPVEFEEPWYRSVIALRAPEVERFDTVAWYDVVEREAPDQVNPVRKRGRATTTGEAAILLHRTDIPRVLVLDASGDTTTIVRWRQEPTPVTDTDLEAFARARTETFDWTPEQEATYLGRIRSGTAEFHPLIGEVEGDADGRIWVSESAIGYIYPRYWVSESDGTRRGWVELPEGLRFLDARDDLLLGTRSDEFGRETVALYRMVPPA